MSSTNTLVVTPFLRNALLLDGLFGGVGCVLMLFGATILAPLTGLPVALLAWAGAALLPWSAILISLARRETMPRLWLIDIIALNALWVAASFGIIVSGVVEPNALGYSFVVMQALAVILFAALQVIALRRNRAAVA